MKKRKFEHEFAILLLLAFAIGFIVLQSNFKFTGYAVSDYTNQTSCLAANYSWVNNTCVDLSLSSTNSTNTNSTITNSTNLTNSTLTNSTNVTNSTEQNVSLTNSTLTNSTACVENWSCVDWSVCENGSQTRTCTDANSCGTSVNEPALSQTCTVACVENWNCTAWTDCSSDGKKTRTCNDLNSCGTTASQPSLLHDCTVPSSATTTSTGQASATSNVIQTPACTPSWNCGEWQECINGTQVRACTDTANCGTQTGIPETSQACVSPIVNTTQTQPKQNFFGLVGSVIKGPVGAVGTFFSNKTNIFIVSGALVALVLGFFTFRFFSKHKISVSKR